jgi:anti-sigma B factor antagonist
MTAQEEDVRWLGRHAIVTMPEEIDLTNSPGLDHLLAGVVAQSPEAITVDLTATSFCDSAGINVLAHVHQLAAENGGQLRIALGDSPVGRIIQLIGLDEIVPVYRDVQQSLDASGPGSAPQAGE